MRLIPLVAAAFVLLVSGPAFGQEWTEYASRADFFTVNFPGEPEVRDIAYPTEYRVTLPGRGASTASQMVRVATPSR